MSSSPMHLRRAVAHGALGRAALTFATHTTRPMRVQLNGLTRAPDK